MTGYGAQVMVRLLPSIAPDGFPPVTARAWRVRVCPMFRPGADCLNRLFTLDSVSSVSYTRAGGALRVQREAASRLQHGHASIRAATP